MKCGAQDRGKDGSCTPCRRARGKAYYQQNKDKIAAKNKAYVAANPEKARAYTKKSYEKHAEKRREAGRGYAQQRRDEMTPEEKKEIYRKHKDYQARWKKDNKDKSSQYAKTYAGKNPEKMKEKWRRNKSRRRGLKLAVGGNLSTNIIEALLSVQKGKCACCGKKLNGEYHLDHIMPLALGGKNEDRNVQLLLPKCNMTKNAKHPIDYMQEKGLLL